jgi:hypothetical protein
MTVGILHVHDIEGTGVTLPAKKNTAAKSGKSGERWKILKASG